MGRKCYPSRVRDARNWLREAAPAVCLKPPALPGVGGSVLPFSGCSAPLCRGWPGTSPGLARPCRAAPCLGRLPCPCRRQVPVPGAVPGRAGDPRAPQPCPAFPALAAGSAGSRGEGGCADGQGHFLFLRLAVSSGE